MMIVTELRRKSRSQAIATIVAAAMVAIASAAHGWAAEEAGRAPFWYDEETGIALGGYDPMSYWIDRQPRRGKSANEATIAGLTWQFLNPGNQGAFVDALALYAPAYGGYDVVGVARGSLTQANPLLWAMYAERLLLFYSPAHKALFEADPARYIAEADRKWPELAKRAPRWPGQRLPNG